MALHNLARMTSATSGTGTLTLGSAVSGFLSFADAGVANGEVVTYAIRDGANSEIGRGTYTSSGTTLSRDTVYESTNSGNKISCSGGQEVFIAAAAENIWKAPTVTTVTTSNLAAAVNTLYFLDLSGLTADRNFVLPAGAPGDWIEVKIATGDATYELVIIGDTGISIEGGSAATEWRKAKNTGESFRFIAETATSWRPVGIIPRATELDYVEFTANVSPTATVEGSANTVVTGSAIDYDGSTIVLIEFFAPNSRPAFDATGRDITFWLFEDGSSIGKIGTVSTGVAVASSNSVVHCYRRITPTAGSHTYSVRATVAGGTGLVAAGAGGAGNNAPGFIRITRANP